MNPSTLQAATDKVKALGGALEALSVENARLRAELEAAREVVEAGRAYLNGSSLTLFVRALDNCDAVTK